MSAPHPAIDRQIARPLAQVFHSMFTESSLTKDQKIKEFMQCMCYEAGKRVARMARMTEANLAIEMNKAYYMRLQVIFADIADDRSYWKKWMGFDFSFANIMTHTHGAGGRNPVFYFDYNNDERLDEVRIDELKTTWTNDFLWRRYNELKSDMQNSMLPTLFKGRIKSINGGDSYETKSGASVQEVIYGYLEVLFDIDANLRFEERTRKRQRTNSASAAPIPTDSAAPAVAQVEKPEIDQSGEIIVRRVVSFSRGAAAAALDAPERWGDSNWRHSNLFAFLLNGPLAHFHPDIGARTVCEFLRKAPRFGPSNAPDRAISHADNRRNQRNEASIVRRTEAGDRQEQLLNQIQTSRQVQTASANVANELMRIGLRIQIAKQNQENKTERIRSMSASLTVLDIEPLSSSLNAAQKLQREQLRSELALACLGVNAPDIDPFTAMLDGVGAAAASAATIIRPASASVVSSVSVADGGASARGGGAVQRGGRGRGVGRVLLRAGYSAGSRMLLHPSAAPGNSAMVPSQLASQYDSNSNSDADAAVSD